MIKVIFVMQKIHQIMTGSKLHAAMRSIVLPRYMNIGGFFNKMTRKPQYQNLAAMIERKFLKMLPVVSF